MQQYNCTHVSLIHPPFRPDPRNTLKEKKRISHPSYDQLFVSYLTKSKKKNLKNGKKSNAPVRITRNSRFYFRRTIRPTRFKRKTAARGREALRHGRFKGCPHRRPCPRQFRCLFNEFPVKWNGSPSRSVARYGVPVQLKCKFARTPPTSRASRGRAQQKF